MNGRCFNLSSNASSFRTIAITKSNIRDKTVLCSYLAVLHRHTMKTRFFRKYSQ